MFEGIDWGLGVVGRKDAGRFLKDTGRSVGRRTIGIHQLEGKAGSHKVSYSPPKAYPQERGRLSIERHCERLQDSIGYIGQYFGRSVAEKSGRFNGHHLGSLSHVVEFGECVGHLDHDRRDGDMKNGGSDPLGRQGGNGTPAADQDHLLVRRRHPRTARRPRLFQQDMGIGILQSRHATRMVHGNLGGKVVHIWITIHHTVSAAITIVQNGSRILRRHGPSSS